MNNSDSSNACIEKIEWVENINGDHEPFLLRRDMARMPRDNTCRIQTWRFVFEKFEWRCLFCVGGVVNE